MRASVVLLLVAATCAGCVTTTPGPESTASTQDPMFQVGWYPESPWAGEPVEFTVVALDPDDPVDAAGWVFGDGTSLEGVEVQHAYADNGTYPVQVTVRTVSGHSTRLERPLEVTAHPPQGPGASDPPDGTENRTMDGNGTSPGEDGFTGFDGEPDDCSKLVPGPFEIGPEAVTGYATRILDVVLLVDSSFLAVHGEDWTRVVDLIAGQADEVYSREVALNVSVVAVFKIPPEYMDLTDTSTVGLGTDESRAVLDISRRFMDDHHPDLDRDLVYTLVGADIAGSVAGQAECIGGARYKDAAYGWGEADDVEDWTLSAGGVVVGDRSTALKVILHEMAHILGAHHHYANCVEHVPHYDLEDAFGTCGMMFNDVGLVGFQFSTLNKMAIRGWAERVDL